MGPKKSKVYDIQLIIMIIGFCFGINVLAPTGMAAGRNAWLAILTGIGLGILFSLSYITLSMWFPGQNLVDIFETIYGRLLGKVMMLPLLWFFFHSGTLVLVVFSQFFTTVVMTDTPGLIFLVAISLVSLLVTRKGIEVIVRCAEILVPVTLLFFIMNTLMLLPKFDWNNVRPVWETPWSDFLAATFQVAVFPFGEIIVFTMVFKNLNKQPGKLFFSVTLGLVFTGLTLAMASFRNISVLGSSIRLYNYPSFEAFKLINIGQVITRLEIIVAINAITMGFIKNSILLYGMALGTARTLNLESGRSLIIPLSLLMIISAIVNFNNVSETTRFIQQTWPLYTVPFELGIPVITLVVACIRRAVGNFSTVNGGGTK